MQMNVYFYWFIIHNLFFILNYILSFDSFPVYQKVCYFSTKNKKKTKENLQSINFFFYIFMHIKKLQASNMNIFKLLFFP